MHGSDEMLLPLPHSLNGYKYADLKVYPGGLCPYFLNAEKGASLEC